LDQAIEELPVVVTCSSIKPKRVFIEVIIQIFMINSSLVCAHHSSLEQGGNSVAMGQQTVTNLLLMAYHFMGIPDGIQSAITFPSIGTNHTDQDRCLLNSFFQAFSGGVRHTSKPNMTNAAVTIYFRCNYN